MIFGGAPVVRLTVLGPRGVPENVREPAISYGASKWYLLTKVDLPLAALSIRTGINQTIMLSLAMVVVASLIGAKELGEDVLEALQYTNVGQGILAGFAILFCTMMLDRTFRGVTANKNTMPILAYSIMVHRILWAIFTPLSYNPRPENLMQGLFDALNMRKLARIVARQ